jgi:5-methylcytosine-specific restriction endonuclease McrA
MSNQERREKNKERARQYYTNNKDNPNFKEKLRLRVERHRKKKKALLESKIAKTEVITDWSRRTSIPLPIRKAVFERDNYSCRKCGWSSKKNVLEIHHIIPYKNEIPLLVTLCHQCHKEAPQGEEEMSEFLKVKLPPEWEKSCIFTKMVMKLYLNKVHQPFLTVRVDDFVDNIYPIALKSAREDNFELLDKFVKEYDVNADD